MNTIDKGFFFFPVSSSIGLHVSGAKWVCVCVCVCWRNRTDKDGSRKEKKNRIMVDA